MKQDQINDKELVAKVLAGNTKAFQTIIHDTQGLVLSIIFKMIKRPEDREDLAQEVYLKAFDKLGSFKFNSKLSTWIGTITYNTCLKFLDKKKVPILNVVDQDGKASWDRLEGKMFGDDTNPTEAYIFGKESAQVLADAIEELPPLYKTIITLFHQEELSYKEIGKITNLPEGTLKNYLFRARKQLKESKPLNAMQWSRASLSGITTRTMASSK